MKNRLVLCFDNKRFGTKTFYLCDTEEEAKAKREAEAKEEKIKADEKKKLESEKKNSEKKSTTPENPKEN